MASGSDPSKVDTSDPLVNKHVDKAQIRQEDVRVSNILVHPIKSCRGTSVTEAFYTPKGLQYDRDWCIIDAKTHEVLTARTLATTVLVVPRLEVDAASPYGGYLVVDVPNGEDGVITFSVPITPTEDILKTWPHISDIMMFNTFKMDGYIVQPLNPSDPSPSDILSQYFKRDVLLAMKGPEERVSPGTSAFPKLDAPVKYQDAFPLLIASEESLQALNDATDRALAATDDPSDPHRVAGMKKEKWRNRKLNIERFRPNIVVKGAGVPFAEDLWREIVIGDNTVPITVVCRCSRCLLPNVDTTTAERDTAVPYKVMLKFGKSETSSPMFGCNAAPEGNGVLRVGDKVIVKRWIEQVA
ncbi:MOSC domain-containing protein [Cristinia sonorae]|uniref:MOSC domain-containing protein n=1 Tax=Cristinia sonorae TaxID=1940300 RepID=A0A8K0UMR3_9AGAR|nr:MOSC domain-containing protein [Cristinia sonorae]